MFILNSKKILSIPSSNKLKKNSLTAPITHRPTSLSTNTYNKPPFDKLNKLEITVLQTTSQTIKNLTNISKQTNNPTTSHAGIYSIPCKDCNKHYICETQRNLEKSIYEHKRSIKQNNDRNAFYSLMLDIKHTFNISQATLLKPIYCEKSRRLLESAVIFKTNHIKQRKGFFQISSYLADMLHENNIRIENG